MSGRNLMWGGFRSHPDAVVVEDEPTLEYLGASLVAAGLAAGSTFRGHRIVPVGSTERTHKHVIKRGKRIRVPLTGKETRRDYVGSETKVEKILEGSPNGLAAIDIWRALVPAIPPGWSYRPPGWLYRLLNRMVHAGRLVKKDLSKSGVARTAKRGVDSVFVMVPREAHT